MKQIMLFFRTKVNLILIGLLVLFAEGYTNPDTVDVEIPQLIASSGDMIELSVNITSDITNVTPQIIAISTQLTWKSNVLNYINVEKGQILPQDWILLSGSVQGPGIDSLKIWMAGTLPLTNKGELAVLTFEVIGEPGDLTSIHFEDMMFNEGEPAAHITDGVVMIPGPPTADFFAEPTVGTAPLTVSFNNLSWGDVTEWLWEFGDGTSSNEKEPTHIYQDPGTYTVRLTATGPAGSDTNEKPDYISVMQPSSVESIPSSATLTASLFQNHPNPFNSETFIKYHIPKAGSVILKIYNHLGQEVRTLVDEKKNAGYFDVRWDGRDDKGIRVSSGIYLYRIQTGNFSDVKKILFMM